MFTLRIKIVAAAVAVVLVAGLSAAVAAWQSTGSGTAQVKATVALASAITPRTPTAAQALYPGATKQAEVTITNPNPYPVIVTYVSGASSTASGTEGTATACAAGAATVDPLGSATSTAPLAQYDPGTGYVVPTSTSIPPSGSAVYLLTTHMVANPDNGCQGQTFDVAVTANLQSA